MSLDLTSTEESKVTKCSSAILTLSRFELSVEPRPGEAHEKHTFQSRAALGVQSVLRMIVDSTSQSSTISDAELIAVPLWCLHLSYLGSILSLELGIVDDDTEKWLTYTQTVKRMLQHLSTRSKLAGTILFHLSKVPIYATTD